MRVGRSVLAWLVVLAGMLHPLAVAHSSSLLPPEHTAAMLRAKGVMVGYDDGLMRWDEPVTRAEAVKIVLVAIGENIPSLNRSAMPFLDVGQDHWAFGYITLAAEIGLVKGRPGRVFDPEQGVTMAEFIVMVSRVYASLGADPGNPLQGIRIEPSWAAPEVGLWCELVELIADGPVSIDLGYPASRGEVAVLTARMMERFGLAYDLSGVLELVSSDGKRVVLRTADTGPSLEVPLDESVGWYPREVGERGQGAIGKVVRIVLNASGKAALVVRQ